MGTLHGRARPALRARVRCDARTVTDLSRRGVGFEAPVIRTSAVGAAWVAGSSPAMTESGSYRPNPARHPVWTASAAFVKESPRNQRAVLPGAARLLCSTVFSGLKRLVRRHNRTHSLQVLVRDNNVDQALKALKKKMQREGIFREMKLRGHYEKPSEKKAREKAEAVRRARKLARKKLQREGLLPSRPVKPVTGPGAPATPRPSF